MVNLVNLLVFEDAEVLTDEQKNVCEQASLKLHHLNDLIEFGASLRAQGQTDIEEPTNNAYETAKDKGQNLDEPTQDELDLGL